MIAIRTEMYPDHRTPGAYVVREFNSDGSVFVTTFDGIEADKRAARYLDWIQTLPPEE